MGARHLSKSQKRKLQQRIKRHKPPVPFEVPAPKNPRQRWLNWEGWGAVGSIATVLALALAAVAAFASPDFRKFVGWHDSSPAQLSPPQQVTPPPNAPKKQGSEEKPEPEKKPEPERGKPSRPHLQYVPFQPPTQVGARPNLVAAMPNGDSAQKTVWFDGKALPVITQRDLDKILTHKVPISDFVKVPGRVDLFVNIQKDGSVTDVQFVAGDKSIAADAGEAVRQWRFKPFLKDGEQVGAQAVIQIDGKKIKSSVPTSARK